MRLFQISAFVFASFFWTISINYVQGPWWSHVISIAVALLYAYLAGGFAEIEFNQLNNQDQTFTAKIKFGTTLSFFPIATAHTVAMLSVGKFG